MSDKNSIKYLKNYAEDEIIHLQSFPYQSTFQHVVVIPAYKETVDFIDNFFVSSLGSSNALLVMVINQPDDEPCPQAQQQLFTAIISRSERLWRQGNLTLVKLLDATSQLLIIDRFTQPIPKKQGVGLARKIGADVALALIEQGNIKSEWIYSTDADVTLPSNYFDAEQNELISSSNSAAIFGFGHQSADVSIHKANLEYENALRYYVAGLKYAGSDYAFFTIGSILVFNRKAYAKVRGFPKRSAGEDFYLLNKLAKLAPIKDISRIKLQIAARPSDRVPFGTGPAVSNILSLNKSGQDYCYYHPALFDCLKLCLAAFDGLWQYIVKDKLDAWSTEHELHIMSALNDIGLDKFLSQQKNLPHNEKGKQQFYKQLHVWFDAFKTLKFLHVLREKYYPNIALSQAIKDAPFTTQLVDYANG